MLQNAYFLAKIGADTAENEQHFAEILPKTGNYPTGPVPIADDLLAPRRPSPRGRPRARRSGWAWRAAHPPARRNPYGRNSFLGWVRVRGLESAKLANFAKFCKFLAGSFSAVSKRNFARKYAFDNSFHTLQDVTLLHRCGLKILAKSRFEKSAIFVKIQQKFANVAKSAEFYRI